MRLSTNNLRRWLFVVLFVPVLVVPVASAYAEPITRLSGVADLASLKQYYSVPNFIIGGKYDPGQPASFELGGAGGVTLESLGREPLGLSYIAVGTPERDKDGKIVNAVIISSYYGGDSAFMYFWWYDGQKGNAFAEGPVVLFRGEAGILVVMRGRKLRSTRNVDHPFSRAA